MSNCRNCGAAANIYNDGCDYCGTNANANKYIPKVRKEFEFNPDEWTHSFDAASFLRKTRCGHNVDTVKDFIEIFGEDAPIAWQEQTGTDWPKRVKRI